MQVRRVALGLLFVGFAFAFFAVPFQGIDLLIDAVGFSLVFNGLRTLQKLEGGFTGGAACCAALVVVSVAQLFVIGPLLLGANILRMLLEVFLFAVLAKGLYAMLARLSCKKAGSLLALALAVCALGSLVWGAWVFMVALPLPVFLSVGFFAVHALLVVGLLCVALLPALAAQEGQP